MSLTIWVFVSFLGFLGVFCFFFSIEMVRASEVMGVKLLPGSTMCGFGHQGWKKFHRNQLGDALTG